MSYMLSDEEFEQMCYWCEGQELSAVWAWVANHDGSFQAKQSQFLDTLRRLIEEGKIQLLDFKSRSLLQGGVDEQIDQFVTSFPLEEHELSDGTWFYGESCPGGALWR
ncbi:hypothetical protein [Variovorax sp. LT1R16]|uniref:hypothetical protein n=1 Tax=Variovorax sp. LT1R16 TaxID=3443728 RepID=UPI003F47A782